ncbi:MAG TPA: membrane dipeptidase, partial [bacterium]|nr:membrane dipeptidase [bacterium]
DLGPDRRKTMCCCGLEISRRQWLWTSLMAAVGSLLAGRAWGQEPSAAALQVLKEHLSVDVHSHGGTKGITSKEAPNDSMASAMRAGGLAAVCLADVPDGPLLGRDAQGVLKALRHAAPGELYEFHLKRLDWVDQLVAQHGVRRALTLADLREAHAAGEPAIVQDIEGLDFLEGKLERIAESQRRGVRHLQLVHYTPNEIGDFQTGEVRHHGLTSFGADVIRECNRLGLVIDVAHATEDTVVQAARVATKPLLLSHTALQGSPAMGKTPLAGRQISPAHAKAVAATGGAVGLWHFFPSLQRYVDGIKEMVDVIGVEHVCIGTDQQVAMGILQDYANLPKLVDLLLQSGFSAAQAGQIVGGNYLRIFAASTGAA